MRAGQTPRNIPSAPTQTLQKLYHQLMVCNQESFGAQEYDVAYHALMAALHCAQPLKDIHYLGEIERVARTQIAEIDTQHPEYTHSTRSAARRGHESIFTLLGRTLDCRP